MSIESANNIPKKGDFSSAITISSSLGLLLFLGLYLGGISLLITALSSSLLFFVSLIISTYRATIKQRQYNEYNYYNNKLYNNLSIPHISKQSNIEKKDNSPMISEDIQQNNKEEINNLNNTYKKDNGIDPSI